jgi:hypothetical protein
MGMMWFISFSVLCSCQYLVWVVLGMTSFLSKGSDHAKGAHTSNIHHFMFENNKKN